MTLKKLTIAFVLRQSLDPMAGGVQRVTLNLGQNFTSLGWNVIFISLAIDGHNPPEGTLLYHPTEDVNNNYILLKSFLDPILIDHNPDVVINQTGLPSETDRVLMELRKAGLFFKIISCFHCNPSIFLDNHRNFVRHLLRNRKYILLVIDHKLGWKLLLMFHRAKNKPLFRKAVSNCDRYLLLSPTFISELRWYIPELDETKIVIIPNGFNIPDIAGLPPKKKKLLFVGRLEQTQKNIFLLPEIWKKVQHRLFEWELHIVGDGPDRAELESIIERFSLERVQLHGQINPTEHYREAKIFLMLSFYEGFPLTLIEAQMYGVVPIVFRSFSAVDWILNDRVDALLEPSFDVDRYADELVSLAMHEDRLHSMSLAAISNAQRFSEEVVNNNWCKVLSDVMFNQEG